MSLNIGDIYWLTVTYPKTNETIKRPVVIYGFENDTPLIASFAAITKSKIDNFDGKYDKWKSPIFKWKDAGLSEPSYVKANNIATIDRKVFKRKDYIGKMDETDLKNAINKIQEFLNSGEEPW